MYSFPIWNQSGSNRFLLTCIQVTQETDKAVWYNHLFKNIPQLVVIKTVKSFSIVNEAKVDVFWNSLAFSIILQMLAILSLVPLPLRNPPYTSGSSWVIYYWSHANLPWFKDLTFQVPMLRYSLQHWTLFSLPDTSTAEHHFCFGLATSSFQSHE